MKITVVAHPRSSEERIVKHDERYYDVYFNVTPERGRANIKIVEMLSSFFDIPKSKIKIISGQRNSLKIIEIVA